MLKRVGVQEVFLPKIIPSDIEFRSTSVDWSEDEHLTIPKEDLAVLNATNWYDQPSRDVWKIASAHFDAAFFIALKGEFFKSICRHYTGAKIWRGYGLAKRVTYHDLLTMLGGQGGPIWNTRIARNVWLGLAYSHLSDIEPPYLAERSVFLPAGLPKTDIDDQWIGDNNKIFFVCPNISASGYYREVYQEFKRAFGDLPHAIAGAQSVRTPDDHVLGYVSNEQHQRNLREFAVMYYHSAEANHIHYHPFEAVRTGMPLIFMSGGLLDKLGGIGLPGRCNSIEEARAKLELVLAGKSELIHDIRRTQGRLLESLTVERCEPSWRAGIELILKKTAEERPTVLTSRKKRIAVILPIAYRGGSLRGAKLLANAVAIGSQQFGSSVDVVFGHPEHLAFYPDREFEDLPADVERRTFRWRTLSEGEARRACAYAGIEGPLMHTTYAVPDDGINQFLDCDLWIFVSDRLELPVLPVRPYLLMIYDYLQRYVPIMDERANQQVVDRAHAAEAVLVTTEFTANDARQFAGLPATKVKKVPLLVPAFGGRNGSTCEKSPPSDYFVWTTNLALHKNHENAFAALQLYYEEYDGRFECHMTGVETDRLFERELPHLMLVRKIHRASKAVKANLKIEGDLPDSVYRRKLRDAAFLWHPGLIDNGTFSVVEAASFSVPALSSDYPAMREIDQQFELNLTWSDPLDPSDMARKLKHMEKAERRTPRPDVFERHSLDRSAGEYWQVIQEYL